MAITQAFSDHVIARFLDFFDSRSHWQRRLWNAGYALSLREVLEATEAVRDGSLSGPALAWLADSVRAKTPRDPGVRPREQRMTLMTALKGQPEHKGAAYEVATLALADLELKYLPRWRDELASGTENPGAEEASRSVASHLIDQRPAPYLLAWLSALVASNPTCTVIDVLDEASQLLEKPPDRFEVMALFQTEPRSRASKPPEWLNSRETARWLAAHSAKKSVRQRGGLLLEIDAYGPHHAVAQAAEVLDRFSARVVVGTRSEAVFFPTVVVKGFPDCGELRPSRMLEVRALERENRVYDLTRAGPIDAALELLSHLESGSSAPAVAGGWSAIEVLLTGPGDDGNVQAANRLASLVACSFPRAELTDLAWSWSRTSDDPIATAIQEAETNRERARVIADAITDQHGFAFPSNSDTAALDRIEKVLGNPRQQLREIRDHVIESFRRLYRQRNLVMHGGRTEAVALDASLRTAAPLVGAGVDRIVHGYLTKRLEPLQLYAQSEVEMDRAGTSAGCHLVDLLE